MTRVARHRCRCLEGVGGICGKLLRGDPQLKFREQLLLHGDDGFRAPCRHFGRGLCLPDRALGLLGQKSPVTERLRVALGDGCGHLAAPRGLAGGFSARSRLGELGALRLEPRKRGSRMRHARPPLTMRGQPFGSLLAQSPGRRRRVQPDLAGPIELSSAQSRQVRFASFVLPAVASTHTHGPDRGQKSISLTSVQNSPSPTKPVQNARPDQRHAFGSTCRCHAAPGCRCLWSRIRPLPLHNYHAFASAVQGVAQAR